MFGSFFPNRARMSGFFQKPGENVWFLLGVCSAVNPSLGPLVTLCGHFIVDDDFLGIIQKSRQE
jgi:hypothetical protein